MIKFILYTCLVIYVNVISIVSLIIKFEFLWYFILLFPARKTNIDEIGKTLYVMTEMFVGLHT